MRKRRTPARVTALLLTVALIIGVLCYGAFVANADNVRQYGTYVCLGDSRIDPTGDCTRAALAAMLSRFDAQHATAT